MNQIDNPSRAKILARITAALATPASPHARSTSDPAFAPVANPLERFQRECAGNNTECVMTPNLDASAIAISNILSALPAGEIFVQDSPELRRMASAWTRHNIRWSSGTAEAASDRRDGPSESSQATITMAEALVAQTGSVLVSAECGGRGAAIVAPVHIVVAKAAAIGPGSGSSFRAGERARNGAPEFLPVFHHRFQPHCGHRKNSGDGSARPAAPRRYRGACHCITRANRLRTQTRRAVSRSPARPPPLHRRTPEFYRVRFSSSDPPR